VLILQHPRERDVGIGTARLARLSLSNVVLRSDVDFGSDPVVQQAIALGNAYVLFPGEDAVAVESARLPAPITLIVLDGTWWQAQKLLRANPALATLPRLRLTPARPSLYGEIRREPADHCVATIEAIAHVLGYLEGDVERFAQLLRPFAAMVDRQRYFATEVATGRQHRNRGPRPRRDPIHPILRTRRGDIVCVHGEANAWPRLHPQHEPPETVHWLARRLETGEAFESVIRPRRRLAPSTCYHIRLPAETLAGGNTWQGFVDSLSAFVRPTDVLLTWGHFPVATLVADGYRLTTATLDVRPIATKALGQRIGTVEDCLAKLGSTPPSPCGAGRGGERLALLCAIAGRLCAWPMD